LSDLLRMIDSKPWYDRLHGYISLLTIKINSVYYIIKMKLTTKILDFMRPSQNPLNYKSYIDRLGFGLGIWIEYNIYTSSNGKPPSSRSLSHQTLIRFALKREYKLLAWLISLATRYDIKTSKVADSLTILPIFEVPARNGCAST
jgi:hypothetical protein